MKHCVKCTFCARGCHGTTGHQIKSGPVALSIEIAWGPILRSYMAYVEEFWV